MAEQYVQFSEVIIDLTEPEEAWLKEQMQVVYVFGDKEYLEHAVPTELADTDADWIGPRFLRHNNHYNSRSASLGFEYNFDGDHDKDLWGRHLWVYAKEFGSPDNVALLVQEFEHLSAR